MKFSIFIKNDPYHSQLPFAALHFCETLLKKNHTLNCLFFYGDGIENLRATNEIFNDWQALAKTKTIDLLACSLSTYARGLTITESTIQLAGLSTFMAHATAADRILRF